MKTHDAAMVIMERFMANALIIIIMSEIHREVVKG
jgi:hypothetical protein